MRHSDAILNMTLKVFILSFHSMPLNVITLLSLSANSTSFFTLSLGSHTFKVSIMGVLASRIFVILPWFPQCFFYVLNETPSLLGSLYLSTIVSWFVPPSFEGFPLFLFSPKFQKYFFLCQLRKKIQWNNRSKHTKFT